MKNIIVKLMISFVIIHLSLVIGYSQTWKELMDSSKLYQGKNDFQKALNWAFQAEAKAKAEFGELDTNYAITYGKIADLYYNLEKMDTFFLYSEKYLSICRKVFILDHAELAMSIRTMAYCYFYMEDFNKSVPLYKEALEMFRRLYKYDHYDLAHSISLVGRCYFYMGNYYEAEPFYKEALEMFRRLFKTDNADLEWCIGSLANCYFYMGNYDKAEPLFKEALEMFRRLDSSGNAELGMRINELARCYLSMEKFDKAEPLFKEALEIYRRYYKSDHSILAWSIRNMAGFYNIIGNNPLAEQFYKESLEMYRRLYKTDHPDLAWSIRNMADFYIKIGNNPLADKLYKESLEMYRRLYTTDHPDLASSIKSMAAFYFMMGNNSKAEPLFIEALDIYRRLYKSDNPDLAKNILALANFYLITGNNNKAEPLFIEAIEMHRRLYKTDHPDLAKNILTLGMLYFIMGNNLKAEKLLIECVEMHRRFYKADHPDLASSINVIAGFYLETGNNSKADPLLKESIEMYERLNITNDTKLIGINLSIIQSNIRKGDYRNAEQLADKTHEMISRFYKSNNFLLASCLIGLAESYKLIGNFNKAEPLFNEAMNILKKSSMTENFFFSKCIWGLAQLLSCKGDIVKAETVYLEAIKVVINYLNNNFPSLSETEKKKFYRMEGDNFESFNTYAIARSKENPLILSNMYDLQLYTKALLLNSSYKIKKRVLNSGDNELKNQYQEWSDMKEFLVKLYKMPNDELKRNNFSIDSIEKLVNDLEKQISLKSEDFRQSYEQKKVTWKSSVQPFLKPDEAAVEVMRFRYFDKNRFTDTIWYAFLIVNDECIDNPDIVVIENGKELEGDSYKLYRKFIGKNIPDKESFNNYWAKVYEKLKKYKRIYLSVDGIYNKVNLSTLIMPDGNYLFDVQDIQLLNSTKDLLLGYYKKQDESSIYNSAVLIGNPNFSLSESLVREVSQKIKKQDNEDYINESLAYTRGIILSKLPGTEKEIKDIEKFLKVKKWDVKSYLGDMALKTAVKTVDNPRVLHIASHGMFLEDIKSDKKFTFGFEEKKLIENPLLRSGLLFTGADNYLKSDSVRPAGDENGLLTAYEAMNLDLDKTELVVLSACETGLGEIQNGEGVFGLRRAFQQAGARTVLMSLWKVSDDATQMLMSNFYKNWVSGMTKREAFHKAQQQVREKYPGPYHWGAFVMVGE